MSNESPNKQLLQTGGLRDVYSVLQEADEYRNVHRGLAIALFIVSAAIGVAGFFLINELALWPGINEYLASLVVTASWVLIFPIWVVTYLIIMFLLGRVGFKDVRAYVRNRLSKLHLNHKELKGLHENLATEDWKYGDLYQSVIDDLVVRRSDAG